MDLRTRGSRQAAVVGALVAVLAGLPASGVAQSSGDDSETTGEQRRAADAGGVSGPVLHEYFQPGDGPGGAAGAGGAGRSSAEGAGGKPDEKATQAGEPPELTLTAGDGDVILGAEGPLDDTRAKSPYGPRSPRRGTTRLDDKTDKVDDLEYYSSFDPSVFPYKRNVAQNRVRKRGGDYQMAVRQGRMEAVEVGGSARADEDTFWGTFLLRAQSGRFHPIPSVAPTQRVLEVHAEPDVPIRLYRDAADNWYLKIRHDGMVRVNAKVAAPRFYFRGAFDGGVGWSEFSTADELGLSAEVRGVADDVLQYVGVSREQSPAEVVEQLIYHFRNFETRALKDGERGEDLYRTLATRQVGVCRHRSLAFVITARALGIPARYVFNEAHAFVELWWPGGGWRRVDLGGAARDIGYNGGAGDRLHDPGGSDRLPRPPEFRRELERLREQSDGDASTPSSGASNDGRRGRGDGSQRSSEQDGRRRRGRPGQQRSGQAQSGDRAAGPQGESPLNPAELAEQVRNRDQRAGRAGEGEASRRPASMTLRANRTSVRRGSTIGVQGQLRAEDGRPLAGRVVRIYLGRVGAQKTENMRELQAVRTDGSGRFSAQISIPKSTSIGRWSILAVFPGDETYQSVRAQ